MWFVFELAGNSNVPFSQFASQMTYQNSEDSCLKPTFDCNTVSNFIVRFSIHWFILLSKVAYSKNELFQSTALKL